MFLIPRGPAVGRFMLSSPPRISFASTAAPLRPPLHSAYRRSSSSGPYMDYSLSPKYWNIWTAKSLESITRNDSTSSTIARTYLFLCIATFPLSWLMVETWKSHWKKRELWINTECGIFETVDHGNFKSDNSRYRILLHKDDIRLLVLHPAEHIEEPVHYNLEHSRLHTEFAKYEALSYAWDHSTPNDIVYDGGQPVRVTSDLHSALKHLRDHHEVRVLWIDALCIDQTDMEERSQQVRLMGDVFSEAERLVIWLGEGTPDVSKAIELINSLHHHLFGHQSYHWFTPGWYQQRDTACIRRNVHQELEHIEWEPLLSFISRAWFRRLWPVQEVVVSSRAVVQCGAEKLSWRVLSDVLWNLCYYGPTPGFLPHHLQACSNVARMQMIRKKPLKPLFLLALLNVDRECSDPRDHIFAVMSIAADRDPFTWDISFDYSLEVREFFKRFAIWDIIHCQSLRALSCAAPTSQQCGGPAVLPSWVPDWTRMRDWTAFIQYNTGFRAAGRTRQEVWFTHNKQVLNTVGYTVDTIESLSSSPRPVKTTSFIEIDEKSVDQIVSFRDWFTECRLVAAPNNTMNPKQYDAFWRTMLCGLTTKGKPVPGRYLEYFDMYEAFLRSAPDKLRFYLENRDEIKTCNSLSSIFQKSYSREFHRWFNRNHRAKALIEGSLVTWSAGRRFCRTSHGRLAQVPTHAALGDKIVVLHGSQVPHVLRPTENGSFQVIGECYVHGLMHGEGLKLPTYRREIFKLC